VELERRAFKRTVSHFLLLVPSAVLVILGRLLRVVPSFRDAFVHWRKYVVYSNYMIGGRRGRREARDIARILLFSFNWLRNNILHIYRETLRYKEKIERLKWRNAHLHCVNCVVLKRKWKLEEFRKRYLLIALKKLLVKSYNVSKLESLIIL